MVLLVLLWVFMKQYIKNENIHIRTGIVVFIYVFVKTIAIVQIMKICQRCTDEKILNYFHRKINYVCLHLWKLIEYLIYQSVHLWHL